MAWCAAVHGVTKSQTRHSNRTTSLSFLMPLRYLLYLAANMFYYNVPRLIFFVFILKFVEFLELGTNAFGN